MRASLEAPFEGFPGKPGVVVVLVCCGEVVMW